MATALPMPLLAPVTRAFWPLSTLRTSHCGVWICGNCSGITSRTDLLSIIMFMVRTGPVLPGEQELGDEAGPARLVRCTDAAPGVAVEIFMKENVVAEVRVARELLVGREHGTPAALVLQEQPGQAARQFVRHFGDAEEDAGAGGALDAKIVAVVTVEPPQRLDQEVIDRHPD